MKRHDDLKFQTVTVFFPRSVFKVLTERAEEMGLPVGRLIAIAVDNELDAPVPFNYPCQLPITTYIEHAYVEEAQKIVNYLNTMPNGMGREMLMLARRDIGIPNRDTLMAAYRELLQCGVIEEVNPPARVKFKGYPAGYKYTRMVQVDKTVFITSRRKRLHAEMEELKAKMAELGEDKGEKDE